MGALLFLKPATARFDLWNATHARTQAFDLCTPTPVTTFAKSTNGLLQSSFSRRLFCGNRWVNYRSQNQSRYKQLILASRW